MEQLPPHSTAANRDFPWATSSAYRHGLELLNRGQYFEAHEVLEDVWREQSGRARQFLQGLIQVAVALHHHSTGNDEGARSVLARAARNLKPYPPDFGNVDLDGLRGLVEQWRDLLERHGPSPAPVRIRILG